MFSSGGAGLDVHNLHICSQLSKITVGSSIFCHIMQRPLGDSGHPSIEKRRTNDLHHSPVTMSMRLTSKSSRHPMFFKSNSQCQQSGDWLRGVSTTDRVEWASPNSPHSPDSPRRSANATFSRNQVDQTEMPRMRPYMEERGSPHPRQFWVLSSRPALKMHNFAVIAVG